MLFYICSSNEFSSDINDLILKFQDWKKFRGYQIKLIVCILHKLYIRSGDECHNESNDNEK